MKAFFEGIQWLFETIFFAARLQLFIGANNWFYTTKMAKKTKIQRLILS